MAEEYRKRVIRSIKLSNGAKFRIKVISARKLIKLLKSEGLTLNELNTIDSGSEKFDAVLKVQDKLLKQYVVFPKIVDESTKKDELGLDEVSIDHTTELIEFITGSGKGESFLSPSTTSKNPQGKYGDIVV